MHRSIIRLGMIITVLLANLGIMAIGTTRAQSAERCFSETGYCISGRIRVFWEQNGGLPVFGFPITPQQTETIEGQPLQVQWFERNRLELHPDNAPPYDVLLGRLGAEHVEQTGAPERDTPQDGCRYFEETGFNVCEPILSTWRSEGLEFDGQSGSSEAENLALFGLPLTGAFETTLADGNTYTVQWFERARFEQHPENQPPYNVLLGLLGVDAGPVAQEQPSAPPASQASLLYSSGGQQHQVNLDTGASSAIGSAPPAGSIPGIDGRYIWVDESDNIVQTNADGSNQQGLLDSGTFYQEFPDYVTLEKRLVMSENNSHVFFIACQPGMGEAATCHFFQLNLSTGAVSRVAAFSNNDPYPTWINPDGERAVYAWDLACKGSLYISNERIPLSGTPISLVWLPDKRFVFSRHICKGQWDAQEVEPQYDIILAKADGSDAQALVAGMIASDMALSPDQQTLAFITTDPSPVALWLVNLDGSGLRQVMDLPSDALDILWR